MKEHKFIVPEFKLRIPKRSPHNYIYPKGKLTYEDQVLTLNSWKLVYALRALIGISISVD